MKNIVLAIKKIFFPSKYSKTSIEKINKTCIIVLGMHRSGTSCLMGTLETYGVHSGNISKSNPFNLKGNREHFDIVALNDKLLKFNNNSWDNPPKNGIHWNHEYEIERDQIINDFLNIEELFFAFKDPRALFTLPFWEEGLKSKVKIQYIGTFRNPDSVISSLQGRDKHISKEKSLFLWKAYNTKLLEYANISTFPIVSYDETKEIYTDTIEGILKNSFNLEKKSTDAFYDKSLKNNNAIYEIKDNDVKKIYNKLQSYVVKNMLSQRKKKLTVIVNFYNMQREAKRTLHTLIESYQKVSSELYDVIVIDNGSSEPLDREFVQNHGSNFFYLYYESKFPSPVEAINFCVKHINSEYIMCLIDGARMLSPNILKYSFNAWKLSNSPFVYTVGMHIGDQLQNISMENGYDQQLEDEILATIDWQENGYTLFSISSLAASSKDGFLSIISESNCFSLKREDYLRIGGLNKKFISPGGGLVNLDFFTQINSLQEIMPILLLGEATFHQFHGGVATNVPMDEHPFGKMNEEYKSIYGHYFKKNTRKPYYFGKLNTKYHTKFIGKVYES